MTDLYEEAMLAAVLAAPKDNAPRLRYADYLSERGSPGDAQRAEFIQVQCELAELPFVGWPTCDRYCDNMGCECPGCSAYYRNSEKRRSLSRRQDSLLNDHGYLWCDGLFGARKMGGIGKERSAVTVRYHVSWRTTGSVRVTFRRGFIGAVLCYFGDWINAGRFAVASQPVEWVEAADWQPEKIDTSTSLWAFYPEQPGWFPEEFNEVAVRLYPSCADAAKAMSDAMIAHAKGG